MRIAIFGVGGVGGYFGGRLAHAGRDVVFIARGVHLEAMLENGLRVDSRLGNFEVKVDASDDPEAVGLVDVVIVAVKAWQVSKAAESIRPMLKKNTVVVPVQNGIEAAIEIADVLGREHVLCGSCAIFSFRLGPGHIKANTTWEPSMSFKEMDNSVSDRVADLRQALDCYGFAVKVPDDIYAVLWSKLISVSPMGAVGAVTRVPGSQWRDSPDALEMYMEAVMEVTDVARASGIAVDDQQLQQLVKAVVSGPVAQLTSMQRDILEGKPSELEAQVGVIHRLGAELSVPTPVYTNMYRSLLPSEMRARDQIEYSSEL
jgi:2-dehydropantoate 2-reductase